MQMASLPRLAILIWLVCLSQLHFDNWADAFRRDALPSRSCRAFNAVRCQGWPGERNT
jgi:hypothetical protein